MAEHIIVIDNVSAHSPQLAVTQPPIRPSILVVDDDHSLLTMIRHVLGPRFDLTLEPDPRRALGLLKAGPEFAVLVSDLRMPGMSGLMLLQGARRLAPNTQRVLISGGAELSDTVNAINECRVFSILIKPFPASKLTETVAEAAEQHRLVSAERVLLEETLQGSIQTLAELFLLVQPAAFGRAMRLRRHVRDLARYLEIAKRWDVEIAALFSQIGSMALPSETLDRWYHGRDLSEEERAEIARLSDTAQSLIANIPRLESVTEILRTKDLPAAWGGVPEGARVLAIAQDFDLLIAQGSIADDALDIMESRTGRYDAAYLHAFRALRGGSAPAVKMQEMLLAEVSEPMVLASDVYAQNGLLLIARGQRVTPGLLHRIKTQWSDLASKAVVRVVLPTA